MNINSHIIPLEGKEGLWQVDNMATVRNHIDLGGDGRES